MRILCSGVPPPLIAGPVRSSLRCGRPGPAADNKDLNNEVRLIIRRAYGFHSGAETALATVMLACGPVNLKLPYHTPATHM